MNQFYTPGNQVGKAHLKLTGQEAKHASKVLRKSVGEEIITTDGDGNRYVGIISSVKKNEVSAEIQEIYTFKKPSVEVILALGLIKKRDRLEFAVEKAVELGVSSILLFRSDHSEPFNVRMDRINATVLSAMKQSLRVYLPGVEICESLDDLIQNRDKITNYIYADQHGDQHEYETPRGRQRLMVVVGPEGGLSNREEKLLKQADAVRLCLGDYRLRTETAAVVLASRFGDSAEIRV